MSAEVLPHIDNPINEDRWGDAKAIADRAGWPRRGMTQTLDAMERQGLVESMRPGYKLSPRSDPPPRLWRRVVAGQVGGCQASGAAPSTRPDDLDPS